MSRGEFHSHGRRVVQPLTFVRRTRNVDSPQMLMEPSLSSSARAPLPSLYYVGPFLLVGLTAALRENLPSVGFRLAVVVGLTAILLHALQFDTGDGHQNYATGSTFGSIFFTVVAMLLLSDPVKEYRHESQKEPTTEMPLWKRFYWAMCIQFSPRGVGWNYQVCATPCV